MKTVDNLVLIGIFITLLMYSIIHFTNLITVPDKKIRRRKTRREDKDRGERRRVLKILSYRYKKYKDYPTFISIT